MERTKGTVKWFSQEKGYGFLQQEGGPDVFVHHSAIQGSGFKVLYEGEEVEFEVMHADKGLKAANVERLNPPAEPPSRGPRREGGRPGGRGYGSRGSDSGGYGPPGPILTGRPRGHASRRVPTAVSATDVRRMPARRRPVVVRPSRPRHVRTGWRGDPRRSDC